MSIQIPPDPVAEEAGAYLREILSRPASLSGMLNTAEEAGSFLLERAAIAGTVGESSAAIADAGVVAGAIASILDLPWIVLALLIIILILVIERGLSGLLGFLPWGWGDKWAAGIRRVFSPVENLENAIVGAAAGVLGGVFHAIAVTVGWGMTQNQAHTAGVATGANSQYLDYLNKRTMALWAWDSRLQSDITALQRALSVPSLTPSPSPVTPFPEPPTVIQNTTVTTPVPQNVWDQLSHLESENQARIHDITGIQSQVSSLTAHMTTLQREFTTLAGNVHSIRALSVGLQDMQNEIETINGLFITFVDESAQTFQRQAHELAQLAPLHLLLQTGAPGMQVLRQLQDTPCMCPKLPNIPRLGAEALAVYEFITHG